MAKATIGRRNVAANQLSLSPTILAKPDGHPTKDQKPKTPARHPTEQRQLEFDVLFDALPDIALRDQRDALERPLVSLSKNIRYEAVEYNFGDLFVRVIPNQNFGQPTIWDYDVIIYLLGQVNERFKRTRDQATEPPPLQMVKTEDGGYRQVRAWSWENPGIRVHPVDLLQAIGRDTSGRAFMELRAAIGRLQSCMIETNIWHGKKLKRFKRFSLISGFQEDDPSEKTSGGMLFTLPDWMIESVESRKGIFAINHRYFDLSGGIERFLYRIARKYAGRQPCGAALKMSTLHERSASPMILRDFAKYVRRAVTNAEMPEYSFSIYRNEHDEEVVQMVWNRGMKVAADEEEAGSDTTMPDPDDSL